MDATKADALPSLPTSLLLLLPTVASCLACSNSYNIASCPAPTIGICGNLDVFLGAFDSRLLFVFRLLHTHRKRLRLALRASRWESLLDHPARALPRYAISHTHTSHKSNVFVLSTGASIKVIAVPQILRPRRSSHCRPPRL